MNPWAPAFPPPHRPTTRETTSTHNAPGHRNAVVAATLSYWERYNERQRGWVKVCNGFALAPYRPAAAGAGLLGMDGPHT